MSDMEDKGSGSPQMAELRSKAEQHVRAGKGRPIMAEADALALVHELQVRQVELEMQNDELQRARMEAEEASEKYCDLFDFAPAGHFLWDHEGRILEVNLAGAALLGLNRSAASQKQFGQFVVAEYRSAFADFLKQVLATDRMQTCEVKLLRDGSLVWGLVEGIATNDRQGPQRLCRAAVIDITQRKRADELAAANKALEVEIAARRQAEDSLRQSEERFRVLGEATFEGIGISRSGIICDCNQQLADILGYERHDLLGHNIAKLVAPESRDVVAANIDARQDACLEHELLRRDGTRCTVEIHGRSLADGMRITSIRDITSRKRAEEALRNSESTSRALLAAVPDLMFRVRSDGTFLGYTGHTESLYTAPEQFLGKTVNEVLPPQVAQSLMACTRETIASGRIELCEYALDIRGECRWFEARVVECGVDEVLHVIREITKRKRAEEALAAAKASAEHAKAAAEQANRAKDHFLAVLSHELRTPLTPVVMGISMLQDRTDLAPVVRETLEMIGRSIDMEARLIDDLLDVSRIARGKIELHKQRVDLCTVIRQVAEVCKPDIEARRLEFGVDLGPAAPSWVEADASRLLQVFWNLLKNAIKFTPYGGCVGIRCRPDQDHLLVEVNDSGIGMEQDALTRVFNAFEQEERSITRQFGGLGLGLAISKALVEMHGGTIEAHSEGRNRGANFRVRLPLASPAAQLKVQAPALAPPATARPLRVLLVEDHPVTAKMIQTALSANGHTVQWASDIASALELAGRNGFDLLISDLGLPDGSGHDLMRQLRERGHAFPGVALSGYGQEEDIQRSREAGFVAHLTKPASREAVVEAIAAAVAE